MRKLLSRNWLTTAYFLSIILFIAGAQVADLPKRPILFYGFAYAGPLIFLIQGWMKSRRSLARHTLGLVIAAGLFYAGMNNAESNWKQITFGWPAYMGLLLILSIFDAPTCEKDGTTFFRPPGAS